MLSIQYLQAYAPDAAILRLLNKASSQEKAAAQDSTNLSNTIASNMNTTFANSQQTQGGLNAQLQRIANAGISGQGFTPGEEANERSQSKEAEAQQDVQAEQALNERNAGPLELPALSAQKMRCSRLMLQLMTPTLNATSRQRMLTSLAQNLTTGLQGLGNLSGQRDESSGCARRHGRRRSRPIIQRRDASTRAILGKFGRKPSESGTRRRY